jgi:hypothetical protein
LAQACCCSRHCLQLLDGSARDAVVMLQTPNTTKIMVAIVGMTISSRSGSLSQRDSLMAR